MIHFPTLLTDLRGFVQQHLLPLEPQLLQAGFRAVLPKLTEIRQQVKARGWWAPFLPVEYGGLGLRLSEYAQVSEELGRTPLGHYAFNGQAPDVGNMELLLAHGSVEQKQRYLEPLARGDIRSCFAMTEPEQAGSNPVWLEATAMPEGEDYLINAHKWFTSGADGATFAIVMAITQPEAKPHQRASQIIVPLDTPGFHLVRNIKMMGEAGEDWLSHAEVRLENCRVPQHNRLGADGAGFALAQERLGPGRIHHCMRWIGICERAFEMLCQRAVARELAPGQPLATRQTTQHWMAECRAQINASRLLVMEAARKIETEGARAARIDISLIKFYVAETLQTVLDRAIQVHGALGVTDDTVLSFWYRHERGARIYDGADEVHKNVVARQILKGYGLDL